MKGDILQSELKEVQLFGDFQSHKAEIDAEDLSWILQILSTNLYSDPIGSLIREYSSNAWDANIEAGNKDKPIEVGIQTTSDSGSYWYVTDLGPGLSPQRINDVYRKFGKSTKRTSNEAIGMMGLGKFSGLSYTNEVFITTRVDGMQYEYLMHKSDGVPQIDLLTTKLVDLPNGTTIKVFIKGWSDRRDFENKTKQQLAFFENVYFNVDGRANFNEMKLLKGKTFTISTLEDRGLRIKLGPVSYPIDWSVINSQVPTLKGLEYNHPFSDIAINFNIGELAITPNRESILYNKDTVKNLVARFTEFQKEIIDLYNGQDHEYENLQMYIDALNAPKLRLNGRYYNVKDFLNIAGVKAITPKIKDLGMTIRINHTAELFYGYATPYTINKGRKLPKNYTKYINCSEEAPHSKQIILGSVGLDPKRNKYVCEKYNTQDWLVIRKSPHVSLFSKSGGSSYVKLLGLHAYPKLQWRSIIQKFQAWQEQLIKKVCVIYDDEAPTAEWLLKEKQGKISTGTINYHSLRKINGKVLIKKAVISNTFGKPCAFQQEDWFIAKLSEQRKFYIYGTEEDKDKLQYLYCFTKATKHNVEVIITAKANHKYLQLASNFIHIDKFMEGKTKYFANYVSMYRLVREANKLRHGELNNARALIKELNEDAASIIMTVHNHAVNWSRVFPYSTEKYENLLNGMEEVAIKNNYLDWDLEAVTDKFKKYAKDFMFTIDIKCAGYGAGNYAKTAEELAAYVCKKRNIRLNSKWYEAKPESTESTNEDE